MTNLPISQNWPAKSSVQTQKIPASRSWHDAPFWQNPPSHVTTKLEKLLNVGYIRYGALLRESRVCKFSLTQCFAEFSSVCRSTFANVGVAIASRASILTLIEDWTVSGRPLVFAVRTVRNCVTFVGSRNTEGRLVAALHLVDCTS